jgi:copper chaperone
MSDQASHTYTVSGMSCEHCRTAVSEEVSSVDGVQEVAIDLESGRVDVRGEGFGDEAIAEAVEEAGYELAGSR